MLDQNTDRMWYVIGAILIGAAVLFGANTMFPTAFASVNTQFESVLDKVAINGLTQREVPDEVWFEDTVVLMETNDFTFLRGWKGAELTWVMDQTVDEWGVTDATRVTAVNGQSWVKAYDTLIYNSELNDDYEYLFSVKVKNIGENPVVFDTNSNGYNTADEQEIAPGESAVIQLSVEKAPYSDMQFQLRSLDDRKLDEVDVLLHTFKLAYREK